MACLKPVTAYKTKSGELTFKAGQGVGFSLKIPCGQCMSCRIDKAREWALRCCHEAQMHETNCFITLTYNDANLPEDHSLHKEHFQDFIRALRYHAGKKLRYFHCGEYGPEKGRPHYHALIFGYDFPDKTLWKETKRNKTYNSPMLDSVWGKGFTTIGDLNWKTAAYCARYVMKKQTGSAAPEIYQYVNPETGEIFKRIPEYATMSRRPGIGRSWFQKFDLDVFPDDFITHQGKKYSVPTYYEKLYASDEGGEKAMELIKMRREKNALARADNNTPERLIVREKVLLSKIKQLKRELS